MHDQRNAELPFCQTQPSQPSSRTRLIHGQAFGTEGSLPGGERKKRKYSQKICTKEILVLDINFFRRQLIRSSSKQFSFIHCGQTVQQQNKLLTQKFSSWIALFFLICISKWLLPRLKAAMNDVCYLSYRAARTWFHVQAVMRSSNF